MIFFCILMQSFFLLSEKIQYSLIQWSQHSRTVVLKWLKHELFLLATVYYWWAQSPIKQDMLLIISVLFNVNYFKCLLLLMNRSYFVN